MADFQYNVAKGRTVELFNRVDSNDPSTSGIIVIPVDVAAVTDATLKDVDTFAAVLSAGVTERSTNGWGRKTLTDADITLAAPNDTSDLRAVTIAAQTWTTVTSGAVTDVIACYAPDVAGADSTLVPLLQFDAPFTPDGSDIVVTPNAAGLMTSS